MIRLLYRHPNLNLEISITDKKSQLSTSFAIPSWYSPQELLSSVADFDWNRKKKLSPLFCKNIHDEASLLAHYLVDQKHAVTEAISEKRAQLDAYVTKLVDDSRVKEKIQQERSMDFVPPNQTYEQHQVYNYTNKFWPLKYRATFSIDAILSSSS